MVAATSIGLGLLEMLPKFRDRKSGVFRSSCCRCCAGRDRYKPKNLFQTSTSPGWWRQPQSDWGCWRCYQNSEIGRAACSDLVCAAALLAVIGINPKTCSSRARHLDGGGNLNRIGAVGDVTKIQRSEERRVPI